MNFPAIWIFGSIGATRLRISFVEADVPHSSKVTIPAGAEPVDLDTIWYLGIRMAFDWRFYF